MTRAIRHELIRATDITATTRYYPPSMTTGAVTTSTEGAELAPGETLALQMVCSGGVTVTVEATLHSTHGRDYAPTWVDITEYGIRESTGTAGAASFVDQTELIWFPGVPIHRYRVKVVTSDATNAVHLVAQTSDLAGRFAQIIGSALPAGAATEATQLARAGTIRHSTTPDKADAATGPMEVNRCGSLFVQASARHRRRLDLTVLAAGTGIATSYASFTEGPCDALRTDTQDLQVYAQPPERALIASQSGADWTGAAGWSRVGNVWTHAAGGGVGDLEITPTGINAIGVGETYCVVYTLVWRAGTSVTEKLGTGAGSARSSSATFLKLITCAGSGKVIFTPTNDADCDIDVSTVYVIPPSAPLTAGSYEAESATAVVAIAAAGTPTVPHTTAKLWGYWLRRAGAVELT